MEQTQYDFSMVKRVVSQFYVYGSVMVGLERWERALADGQNCLPDNEVVSFTLELIRAMDRPRMLDRFQGYARAVLSDAEFAELVVKPQVNYDFEQLLQFIADQDNADLLDEITKLRNLILTGEWLAVSMSPEITDLLRLMITLRPRLSVRLYRYYLLLIPVAGG